MDIELDYMEQMAKEYAEMLKQHPLPTAHSYKSTPPVADGDYTAQLNAVQYLLSRAETTYKAQYLEVLKRQFLALGGQEGKQKNYSCPDAAYRALLKKQAEILYKNQQFDACDPSFMRLSLTTAVISVLSK